MKKYDYLIVGAGLFGAVFAYEAMKRGKTCLVIERRDHIAGNIYCETIEDIHVHKYGAHIFHTSNQEVWNYINQFAEFNNYINSPIAIYKDELYNLPFNMNTFSKMWNIRTPQEAKNHIAQQIAALNITEPKNLEEQALSLVGTDVYEKLIKGYTEKQWGRNCTDLPSFIIKRLPLRSRNIRTLQTRPSSLDRLMPSLITSWAFWNTAAFALKPKCWIAKTIRAMQL